MYHSKKTCRAYVLALSAGSFFLSLAFGDNLVGGQTTQINKLQKSKPNYVPKCFCFSGDGKFLFVGGAGGLPLPRSLAKSEADEYYFGTPDWELRIFDWASQEIVDRRRGIYANNRKGTVGRAVMIDFVCSDDGKYAIGIIEYLPGLQEVEADGIVCTAWRIKDWKVIASRCVWEAGRKDHISIGPRKFLASELGGPIRVLATSDGLRVWEINEDGKNHVSCAIITSEHASIDNIWNFGFALSRDNKKIAITGKFGVKVRDLFADKDNGIHGKFYRDGHIGPVGCAAFSPDGTILATGAGTVQDLFGQTDEYYRDEPKDHTVQLRDLRTGKIVGALKFHNSYINQVAFNHDGLSLITYVADDALLRVWEAKSARLLREIKIKPLLREHPARNCFAVHPTANIIAALHLDGVIRLWNIDTGKVIAEISN